MTGVAFSLTALSLGFMAYGYASGNKKVTVTEDIAAFKEFFEKAKAKIRSSAPKIQGSSIKPDGTI